MPTSLAKWRTCFLELCCLPTCPYLCNWSLAALIVVIKRFCRVRPACTNVRSSQGLYYWLLSITFHSDFLETENQWIVPDSKNKLLYTYTAERVNICYDVSMTLIMLNPSLCNRPTPIQPVTGLIKYWALFEYQTSCMKTFPTSHWTITHVLSRNPNWTGGLKLKVKLK